MKGRWVTVVLGANPRRPGETGLDRMPPSALCNWFAPHQPEAVGNQLLGGDSGFATHPVDDVHQAWIAWGVGG